MAKKSIDEELNAALAAGAELAADNKFTKNGQPIAVRSMENLYDPLEVGDEFIIPANYKVVNVKFNEDDTEKHPCIFVEVRCADGSERNMRWFPNSLCKVITPIVDGKRQAKVKTTGSATETYRSKLTIDEALPLLVNRRIRVVAADIYTVRDSRTKELRDTHIYKYDLV